jgi:hypothetical protein
VCPERDKNSHLGDDGAYHPENTVHFRLLGLLLTFVQKHLYIVNSPPRREVAVDAFKAPEVTIAEEGEQSLDANKSASSTPAADGKKVLAGSTNTVAMGEEED